MAKQIEFHNEVTTNEGAHGVERLFHANVMGSKEMQALLALVDKQLKRFHLERERTARIEVILDTIEPKVGRGVVSEPKVGSKPETPQPVKKTGIIMR